jgi:putative NIF3 family GTP cyclohydrolase 1 type 2
VRRPRRALKERRLGTSNATSAMTTIADFIEELDEIAPPDLADADDRVGLQVGDRSRETRRVCVSVDTSVAVVDLAIERRAGLLVAHHPLIYTPLVSLAEDDPVARRVTTLIRANAALFVLHTNYDTAPASAMALRTFSTASSGTNTAILT